MRGIVGVACVGLALAAFDAPVSAQSRFEVMGLRLYMSATDIRAALHSQTRGISRHTHPCRSDPSATCTASLTATLPDGVLVVRFVEVPAGFNDGREAAYSIVYDIRGRGADDSDRVRAAAIDRFGPASGGPNVWCANMGAGGCAPDQPIMRFVPGSSTTAGELTLSDQGFLTRLSSGGSR